MHARGHRESGTRFHVCQHVQMEHELEVMHVKMLDTEVSWISCCL